MSRADFLISSLAVHAVLLIIAVLLPPPFPSPPGYTDTDLAYVELAPEYNTQNKDTNPLSIPVNTAMQMAGTVSVNIGGGSSAPAGKSVLPSAPKPDTQTSTSTAQPARPAQPQAQSGDGTPAREGRPGGAQPAPQPRPAQPAVPTPAASAAQDSPMVAVATAEKGMVALVTGRDSINFRSQKGWPAPPMVRVDVRMEGGNGMAGKWRAEADHDWLIVSGGGPGGQLQVGVMPVGLGVGFYQAEVRLVPYDTSAKGTALPVSLMVLPEEPGKPELRHFAWDAYMDGECKVCHLPDAVMPSPDFMVKPEFCALCHTKDGMAATKLIGQGGHPVGVKAGANGTRMPSYGTVLTGPYSDSMKSHLPNGRVVCITCHNVMYKPGDYGRTWELASGEGKCGYMLEKGGWAAMGSLKPRVYITRGLTPAPKMYSGLDKFLVPPSGYVYDEREGSIRFDTPREPGDVVYVTLSNPYLRVTTENNAICYDCHTQNTHQGLSCMTCHAAHGTANIMAVRGTVRRPNAKAHKVAFSAYSGADSFATGTGSGICEVCHTRTKYHTGKGVSGMRQNGNHHMSSDCTGCHTHENGFAAGRG